MNISDAIILTVMISSMLAPVVLAFVRFGGPTEGFKHTGSFFTRVFESIAILFGGEPPKRPAIEAKLTLDEMGMTLWEASDAHYDVKALNRIKQSHQLEHKLWLNFAGEGHWANNEERELVGLPKKRTAEENARLGLVTADHIVTVQNWGGDVIRTNRGITHEQAERILNRAKQINADRDDSFDIWDEDADETLLMQKCSEHPADQECYYCDPDIRHTSYPKRQRRKQ